MGIVYVVGLTVKTPSLFMPLTPVAIIWTPSGRKLAVTAPAGKGALRPRLQWLHLLATPQVVLAPLGLKRSLTSSILSSERARRPCRTRGGSVVFAGSSGGAGEEAGGAGEEASIAASSTAPQISRASPFVMSLTS